MAESLLKYGARVYRMKDGVIHVKQTMKRGEGHDDRYTIDEQKEAHVNPGDDALLGRTIRDALDGKLERGS
jgi:hypothetical protein